MTSSGTPSAPIALTFRGLNASAVARNRWDQLAYIRRNPEVKIYLHQASLASKISVPFSLIPIISQFTSPWPPLTDLGAPRSAPLHSPLSPQFSLLLTTLCVATLP